MKRLKRLPMTLMIRDLATWGPMGEPEAGYSVAIACMRDLAPLAVANLRMCARAAGGRLREVILVFDCPAEQIPEAVRQAARETSGTAPVSLLGYAARQHRVARLINWGWVYSWLSWSLAIGHATTRAVILHDLDALPLAEGFFERLYDHWVEEGAEFCGAFRYRRAGTIDEGMNLVGTFELVLDAAHLRREFGPFDLFNKVEIVGGRVIDFDTTLFAQWRSPRRAVRPIDEMHLVHPTQLICQYTDLIAGRSDFRGSYNSLPLLAYFMYLGGDPTPMATSAPGLADDKSPDISLFGRTAFIDGIDPSLWARMEKQVRRIEQHLFGATRPEVESFLGGFARRAGEHRLVGREAGTSGVPEM